MSTIRHGASLAAVRVTYLLLLLLQPVWHVLLPLPLGNRNWVLALLATVPLLLPLRGILAGSLRSMTWGGYLSILYLVIGVMEAWSNPAQRLPALTQTILVAVFIAVLLKFSRQVRESD